MSFDGHYTDSHPHINVGRNGNAKSFKDSQEAAFRRMVRHAIRKGPFTRAERDVTMTVINHWFHHKGGAKPFIHPNREAIAKKAKVSVKTVSRSLEMLRTIGALVAVSGTSGGRAKATQYRVSVPPLMVYCGCDWVHDFMRGYRENVPVLASVNRVKMSRCIYNVGATLCHEGEI